jgi:hypothetical protein
MLLYHLSDMDLRKYYWNRHYTRMSAIKAELDVLVLHLPICVSVGKILPTIVRLIVKLDKRP